MPVPAARGVHRRTLLRDDVYFSLRDAIVSAPDRTTTKAKR